jgi:cyclopropane fatty-acyl-phospholipid synthase-like methyltransferase
MPLNRCVADFIPKIKANGSVLDIGCGTGYPILKHLAEHGFFVTGIDVSEKMIDKATELNLPNTKLFQCDFFDFQPTERYDGIIAFDSFFHFPKERQADIYSKISDWMNIGAYLLFTHGKRDNERKDYMFGEVFYYSSLSIRDVYKLLTNNGFIVETSIEDYKETTTGERELLIVAKKFRLKKSVNLL